MRSTARSRRSGAARRVIGAGVVMTLAAAAMVASSATASSSGNGATVAPSLTEAAASGTLDARELQRVLSRQALPSTELIPVTRDSHIWNGAAWQNVPIDLSDYGYVEREYYLSGTSNVYDWVPGGDYETSVLTSGDYTTRLDVRRPKNMKNWSGKVVVEMINMSAGYDWTAVWSALWERVLADGDIYVGITAKPNVLPGMVQFDAERYGPLSFANPVPADEQACGLLPDEEGYDPNLSKLYENGLIWDALTQTGRLLKSNSRDNPLREPAKQVILSGESQSSNFLLTYYRWFTPSAKLASGKPVYDAYFAETQVGITAGDAAGHDRRRHADQPVRPGDQPAGRRRPAADDVPAALGAVDGDQLAVGLPGRARLDGAGRLQHGQEQGAFLGARRLEPRLGVAVPLRRCDRRGPPQGRLLGSGDLRLVLRPEQPRGPVLHGGEGRVRSTSALGCRRAGAGTCATDPDRAVGHDRHDACTTGSATGWAG